MLLYLVYYLFYVFNNMMVLNRVVFRISIFILDFFFLSECILITSSI